MTADETTPASQCRWGPERAEVALPNASWAAACIPHALERGGGHVASLAEAAEVAREREEVER